jgi:hypothetical protein
VISERRTAGALLLSELRLAERSRAEGEWSIGRLGGFDLAGTAHVTLAGGVRVALVVRRSACDQEIAVEPDLTPLGLISRLEHILERFEVDPRHARPRRPARGSCPASRLSRRPPIARPRPAALRGKLGSG